MMKKILIDANPVIPFLISGKQTGIGRTCLDLIKSLNEIEKDLPFKIDLYTQNLKGISAKKLRTKFKSHHIYLRNTISYKKIVSRLSLREFISGYDLMHITHNFEIVRDPSKCIVTAHDAFYMKFDAVNFDYASMRITYPRFLRACRHIITCSEYSKNDIIETMGIEPEKITVIPWGINHSVFYEVPREEARNYVAKEFGLERPFFLSVSCDNGRKRTPQLIEAYLSLENPENDLVLAWSNPPEDLKRIVSDNSRIHFLKNVSDEGLRYLYNYATAAFNPTSYEGFGLPILEAMACGCPAITCNNSSLPEVGKDVAIYLEEPIHDSLPKVMRAIEDNTFDLSSNIKRGPKQAANFNWKNTANLTAELYESLLLI